MSRVGIFARVAIGCIPSGLLACAAYNYGPPGSIEDFQEIILATGLAAILALVILFSAERPVNPASQLATLGVALDAIQSARVNIDPSHYHAWLESLERILRQIPSYEPPCETRLAPLQLTHHPTDT
jgi:hypothetical protein